MNIYDQMQKNINSNKLEKIKKTYEQMRDITIWEKHLKTIREAENAFMNNKTKDTEANLEIAIRQFEIDDMKLYGYKRIIDGEDYSKVTEEIQEKITGYTKEIEFFRGMMT